MFIKQFLLFRINNLYGRYIVDLWLLLTIFSPFRPCSLRCYLTKLCFLSGITREMCNKYSQGSQIEMKLLIKLISQQQGKDEVIQFVSYFNPRQQTTMKNISKQALQAYTTLLKYSQMSAEHEIGFRNVELSAKSHIHQIFTVNKSYKQKQKQRPDLVLLHGFAGSAMSYIRTFNILSKHYNVHALDHYGNGFSTRHDYDQSKTRDQLLALYVDSIQQWRRTMAIQKITLAGHSFGGYLAALYMLGHQQNVDRLILLSPVGTSSQAQIHQEIQSRKAQSLKNRITIGLIQKIYNMNIQPSRMFSIPVIGQVLVNQFLKSTIKLEKKQKQVWKQYIKYISQQQSHLEKSFYHCFEWPFVSKMMSISQILEKIVQKEKDKSIQFYYGQKDWTEQIAAKKLHSKHSNIHFEIIPNSTHNMIFDFPVEVSDRVINGPLKGRLQFSKL